MTSESKAEGEQWHYRKDKWHYRKDTGEYLVFRERHHYDPEFHIVFHGVRTTRGEPENLRREALVKQIIADHNTAEDAKAAARLAVEVLNKAEAVTLDVIASETGFAKRQLTANDVLIFMRGGITAARAALADSRLAPYAAQPTTRQEEAETR